RSRRRRMEGRIAPHVLIFPLPAQGHVNSMLKLSELICLAGIQVTFFVSEHDHALLLVHSDVHRRLTRLPGTFQFHTYPDGLPHDSLRSGQVFVSHIYSSLRFTIKQFFLDYLTNSATQSPPATCIIADGGMSSCVLDVGEQRNIPIIYFRTIGASCFWCYHRFPQLIQSNELPFQGTDLDLPIQNVTTMEGFLRRRDLPNMCRTCDLNDLAIQSIMTETLSSRRAHGIIFNTFEDLEGPVLDEIRTEIPNVYTIGPIHAHLKTRLAENEKETLSISATNSLWKEDRSFMGWLDSQSDKSVIYASFGSLTILTKEQLLEFWYGLVNSGRPFLWVVRPDSVTDDQDGQIPTELEDGTRDRGRIVGWVPQVEVLSHPAIGVFLTHSGWNSTLESIEIGVPMICWPFFYDQYLNSRLVGGLWKLGLDMKDICDRVVVKRMIDEVMDVRRDEFVRRANRMAELTRKAITSGGSSYSNFDRLIDDIRSMAHAEKSDFTATRWLTKYNLYFFKIGNIYQISGLCRVGERVNNKEEEDLKRRKRMEGRIPPHVLIFPLPAQGHVNSMLKLSELICLAGIHVTFFVSDHDHDLLLLHSDVHRRLSRFPGTFQFHTYPDGLPHDSLRSGQVFASHIFSSLRFTIKQFFLDYLHNSSTQSPPPATCIIADGAISSCVLDVGEQRSIPIIYFRTIGASCFWCYYRFPQLIQSNELPFQGTDLDLPIQNVTTMEGILRRRDLPNMCRTCDLNDLAIQSIMTETLSSRRAHGIIFNTFEDLEGPVLDEIRTQIPNVYTIGPIHAHLKTRLAENEEEETSSISATNSLWKEDRSFMGWLDSQSDKSVIYASFGSLTILTKEQLLEFWYGLVNSGRPFLWVVRPDSVTDDQDGQIPTELEDGTRDRGRIVGWVPQVEVLSHPAIGVFLTHSGWNSTLESIEIGVPMICWPFFYDQYLNSRLVGGLWKLGLDMKDICDRVVVKTMIDEVMDVRRDEFVRRSKRMAELTRKAITSGGSSYSNFDRLIDDIRSMAHAEKSDFTS
ncbi:uncharacterized protein LOC124929622, partial [Impatiens glandulifera]|uniref:uncharacterized protein LOC124929622 n=1 Tax=Impatiens glandulifera TaxID=253017 RepID=UPI001FB0E056